LYIVILSSSIFQFTFISSSYSKHIYNHLSNLSCHLFPHTICIFTYVPRTFCNKSIIKHLRRVFFELPPLHSRDFDGSISSDAYLKMKVSHHKLLLWDDTLTRYNLIIYTVWSLLSSSKDKIDLIRMLIIVESN
jgi:hypothetical protein